MNYQIVFTDELYHHGIKGQKWGVRRYQNYDGTKKGSNKKSAKKKSTYDSSYDFRKAAKLGIMAAMCGLYAYQKMKNVKVSDIKPPTTPPVETIFDINKELSKLKVVDYIEKYGKSEYDNIYLDAQLAKLYANNHNWK